MQLGILALAFMALNQLADAFAWGSQRKEAVDSRIGDTHRVDYSRSQPPLPNVYAMALNELQELESEPICHRNAARLLVNHCQLLEGKDEATVWTDSGRIARDFVDSYAASLAICDLERGSFQIPHTCSKFQERTLAALPIPSKPELHVSTPEIDRCLEGLAQSDSAWNTWVSYRHKALRFCDAARADNEKDQHIQLHQRLTRILSRLTVEVESHMEARLKELDKAIEKTSTNLQNLGPQIDIVTKGLEEVEDMVSTRLFNAAETSREVINGASVEAKSLQKFLVAMMQEMVKRTEEVATSYETTLQAVTAKANNGAEAIATTLNSAVTSSALLQNELGRSQARAEEIALRQQKAEAAMHFIEAYVDSMSSMYHEHGEKLKQAQLRADQILGTLDSAASSATLFQSSVWRTFGFTGWWPYIYCPVASLVMGSYGLPPSASRNIVLVGLGEVAGYLVSNIANYIAFILPAGEPIKTGGIDPNSVSFRGDLHSDADSIIDIQDLQTSTHGRTG